MKREDKHRRPRNITRVGCRVKFIIARQRNTGQWYVKDFIDDHNHPLALEDLSCLLHSHRRISDEQKADILEMEISGIRKYQIFEIQEMQYGGYDKVGYTQRACIISTIAISRGQLLLVMLQQSSDTLGNVNAASLIFFQEHD